MKKIFALTLSWNGKSKLEKLLPGLANNLSNITMEDGKLKNGWDYPEWHIRDNGSKDGTVEAVNGWQYMSNVLLPTTIYPINHNRDNFSQGVNYLFEKANPKDDDLILLLNNDIEFNDDTSLLNMINLMTDEVGVVGAKLLYPGTNRLQHAGVIFSEKYNFMPFHYRPNEIDDENSSKNRYFQAVTAACCLVKASEFKRINGLNASLSWAFEDIIMAGQIGKNKKIVYCGNTNISHFESASLKLNPVNKLFLNENVKNYRKLSEGLFHLDHKFYLENRSYNEIKAK